MRNAELLSPARRLRNGCSFDTAAFNYRFDEQNNLFSALAEGSVAPDSVVEQEYHQLTKAERLHFFTLLCQSSFAGLKGADYRLLKARFDPANQYRIIASSRGKKDVFECFKFEGRYHIGRQLFIKESLITSVSRIAPSAGE